MFSEAIIDFARSLPQNAVNYPLISQVVRSGTSVGANYFEADEALSKKDFVYRIRICIKETKETLYWLRLLGKDYPGKSINELLTESRELLLIFASSVNTAKQRPTEIVR